MNIKLSVIIPSYKDPYSMKTIRSLLDNSTLGDQLEVIDVLDGYWPSFELIEDPRVKYVHLGANRGMRGAICAGMAIAKGEFVARSDEHIMFCPGWDKILTESCKDNWIMTGKRFFLDPIKWEIIKDLPPVECEKLVIQDCGNGVKKFAGQRWDSRAKEFKDTPILESLAMQGSFWCMKRSWWDEVIGALQTDGYGPLYGDSHEIVFKTWKAGGKLMVNKNMWYAHKHRSFSRTHSDGSPENPANKTEGWTYSLNLWKEYYEKVIKPKWKI